MRDGWARALGDSGAHDEALAKFAEAEKIDKERAQLSPLGKRAARRTGRASRSAMRMIAKAHELAAKQGLLL